MIIAMYPILARYGSHFIYSYTVVLALGVLGGIVLTRRSSRQGLAPQWFDALLLVIAAAVVGGRFGFIIWRWDYFQERLSEAWQIWQGGLSYHAALLAGLLALIFWTALSGRSFYRYAALFAPAFLLVTLFGWLACWFEGCVYGQETVIGWLSGDLPDEYGVFAVRYQTQLLGFLLTMAVLIFILWYQKKRPAANVFLLALSAVSLAHLLLTFWRADPTFIIGRLRLDTIINGLLVLISLLLLQYMRMKSKRLEKKA